MSPTPRRRAAAGRLLASGLALGLFTLPGCGSGGDAAEGSSPVELTDLTSFTRSEEPEGMQRSEPGAELQPADGVEATWERWGPDQLPPAPAPEVRSDQELLLVWGGTDADRMQVSGASRSGDRLTVEIDIETADDSCASAAVVEGPVAVFAVPADAVAGVVETVGEVTESSFGC